MTIRSFHPHRLLYRRLCPSLLRPRAPFQQRRHLASLAWQGAGCVGLSGASGAAAGRPQPATKRGPPRVAAWRGGATLARRAVAAWRRQDDSPLHPARASQGARHDGEGEEEAALASVAGETPTTATGGAMPRAVGHRGGHAIGLGPYSGTQGEQAHDLPPTPSRGGRRHARAGPR